MKWSWAGHLSGSIVCRSFDSCCSSSTFMLCKHLTSRTPTLWYSRRHTMSSACLVIFALYDLYDLVVIRRICSIMARNFTICRDNRTNSVFVRVWFSRFRVILSVLRVDMCTDVASLIFVVHYNTSRVVLRSTSSVAEEP